MPFKILRLRRSKDRFITKRKWLNSKHTFSFGEHRDQLWDNFGKIRVINEDIIRANSGFGLHSHSNMEIVTIVIEGIITHKDSLNNIGIINKDEVQIMSSGKGISHSEVNETNKDCKLFQIWIYPYKQNLNPSYNKISIKDVFGNNLIIDSKKNDDSILFIRQDISIWRCKYKLSKENYLPLEIKKINWMQIVSGNLVIKYKNKKSNIYLSSGDGLGFEISDYNDISIKAQTEVDILLFSMSNL